jgi:hypothetical protein
LFNPRRRWNKFKFKPEARFQFRCFEKLAAEGLIPAPGMQKEAAEPTPAVVVPATRAECFAGFSIDRITGKY